MEALAGSLPAPRQASLRWLHDPKDGRVIDQGVVLWFPAPGSFTGEDVVEFHIHGGLATVAALTAVLSEQPGCRAALPGEFTRRAFQNRRLDLTEVEALADLIAAETEAQRVLALRGVAGEARRLYEDWRTRLIEIMALVEATIDFSDEEIPDDLILRAKQQANLLRVAMQHHLGDDNVGERLREGFRIAILGAPNVGKSSLLNRLVARDAAIVTSVAGTTRDPIEVHLNLGGYPVTIIDTAGLRASEDPIEAEGIRRTRERAESADLRVIVIDQSDSSGLSVDVESLATGAFLIVANKSDLNSASQFSQARSVSAVSVSAVTGEGMGELIALLTDRARENLSVGASLPVMRARHREAVVMAITSLSRVDSAEGADLIAEDLRLAARAIGSITGRVDVEDWLDVIFKEFCIGK
jgi:tRNA modification GTPase